MFKTPKDYKFATPDSSYNVEYRIAPNDQVTFQLYANDAFKLIDLTATGTGGASTTMYSQNTGVTYGIEQSGEVKLPVIGKIKLAGLTVREAEILLEQKFSTFYNKPFAILRVTNKRIFIFPGAAATARVIPLVNENTSLIEAIALSGGLAQTGKAFRVKLIRGDLKNPKVFLIDLSTLEGIQKANMLVQANDIVYVEQVPNIPQGIIVQIAPYISLLSSAVLMITLFTTFQSKVR